MNSEKIKFEFGKAEEKEIEIPKEELKKIDTFFHSKYILLRKREIIKNPEDFEKLCQKDEVREILGRFKDLENKEKYLPYLESLLGYGGKYKGWLNEILRIENLWEFKTSHLEKELKSILNKIKDLKIEIKPEEAEKIVEETLREKNSALQYIFPCQVI